MARGLRGNRFVGALFVSASLFLANPEAESQNLPASVQPADGLLSHRAIYRLSLAHRQKSSSPSHVSGIMAYSFQDACDGWMIENRVAMKLVYDEGRSVETDWRFSSWEAKDGRRFRFNVKQKHNGRVIEDLTGVAQLEGPSGKAGGWARFSGTKEVEQTLSRGTLFPTSHLLFSIKAATEGKALLFKPLFDGGGVENPYETSLHITDVTNYPAGEGRRSQVAFDRFKGVPADVPAWRFRIAFFSQMARDQLPAFEMDVDYRADGLAGRILQEFDDFGILMLPQSIEPTPKAEC